MTTDNSADLAREGLSSGHVRYSTGAIVLHWLLALAMAFQVALGFAMPHQGPHSFAPMQLHKSIGITILLLTLIRLAWRLVRRPPDAVERGLTAMLAKIVHWSFYAVLLLGPITGWIIVSTARLRVPTILFGVVPWPHLPLPGSLSEPMESVHEALAWIAIALFVLHVLGALRHQFMLRDPVIGRMSPGGSVAAAIVLLIATVAIYFGVGFYVSQKYLLPALQSGRASAPRGPPRTRRCHCRRPLRGPELLRRRSRPRPRPHKRQALPRCGRSQAERSSASRSATAAPRSSGSFKAWNGTIQMDPDHPQSADIRMTIKLASASVGDATQNAMLQGAEFFATSADPVATWRSARVTQTNSGHYRASGTLTLKGKSRPQAIDFTLSGDGLRRHVTGSASIDRTAFGIGTGQAGEGLGKLVSLNFAFDATGEGR